MSNQTYIKKDRISFAQNLNETIVIAPSNITTNALFIGPNSAISYDVNSNVQNINYLQGITLSNQYIYADGTYLSNIPSGIGVSQSNLNSTITGLGTFQYISSASLQSTVIGVQGGGGLTQTILNSTIVGLGTFGYISTNTGGGISQSNLTSSLTGLGNLGYISSSQLFSSIAAAEASTVKGLGNLGYISSSQLISSVKGLGNIYLSTAITQPNLTSSLIGLGNLGYISSGQLISTVQGLGDIYLSTAITQPNLTSTVIGLGNLGYISSSQLFSSIGASESSTVKGLGTLGYISSSQLTSTVQGLGNIYLSSITNSLQSTVTGLGSAGYISSSQLISSVKGLGNIYLSSATKQIDITSSLIGLATFGYVSSSQLISTVIGLGSGSSAANWWMYPALGTLDMCNNIISNVQQINVDSISSATSGFTAFLNFVNFQNNRIFAVTDLQVDSFSPNNYGIIRFDGSADMNSGYIDNINAAYFGYSITTTYKDGLYMQEYTDPDGFTTPTLGLYARGIPFVGTSLDNSCVNLYNVSKTYFCDSGVPTSFANAIFSYNGIFYYSNVGSGISNPIGGSGDVSLWANYPAVSNVNMNTNILSNASGVETSYVSMDTLYGYTTPDINVYANLFMNTNSINNLSSISLSNTSNTSTVTLSYGVNAYLNGDIYNELIFNTTPFLSEIQPNYMYLNNMAVFQFNDLENNNKMELISLYDQLYAYIYDSNYNYICNYVLGPQTWSYYPALQDVNMGGSNGISNASYVTTNSLTLQTQIPYYANMNLSYTFDIFPDPMNAYSGFYEILNFDGQPFAMFNANTTGLFTMPNVYTLGFPDYTHNYDTFLYNNSNDNNRFYYNIYDNTTSITLSNRAIAQDWSFYAAENSVSMNNNDINSLHGISAYGSYAVEFNSPIDMLNKSLSNVSSLGFYDVVTTSSNSVLYCSNSLLYYNNSNEIIGGTLQYLPQLISFSPFNPKKIANLALWLDAIDASTFNLDSGYVYQWYDKSQNSNIFTMIGTEPLYDGSNVAFDGTDYMESIYSLIYTTNTYIFIVASLIGTDFEMSFALNDINGGDYSLRYVSGEYHNSDVYDTLYHVYNANGYLNGTVDFTRNHVIDGYFNSADTSIMRLSSDFMGRYFIGNINEVIIYNGLLTNNEITQVRNYLTTKWSIPAFDPTQIPNLGLWLDGKDTNTFTIAGGYIQQWNDKSVNVNNFTPSYGDTTYINGAVFTGYSILSSSTSLVFDTNTYVFMVASLVVVTIPGRDAVRMAFATTSDYSMRYYDSYYAPLGGGADILTSYNANGIANGSIDFTQTHIIDGAFSADGSSVMQLSSDINSRYFTGSINEIVVYNGPSQITTDQINQVRTYLATKWAITL